MGRLGGGSGSEGAGSQDRGPASLCFLPAPAVAQLAQAFARLVVRDDEFLEGLKPLVVAQLQRFPPQSLAMVANAYARLGGYDHIAVSQLLNAHAKARVFDREFFLAAVRWMTPSRLSTYTPQSVSNSLHAIARFPALWDQREDRMQVHALFATCVTEALPRLGRFAVQNLVNMLQAFSEVGFYEPSLFAEATHELVQRRASWKTQDAANLASALSRVEFFDASAFEAVAALTAKRAADFRNDELATVLNALAHHARRWQGGAGEEEQDEEELMPAMAPAFAAAAARLTPEALAQCSTFEVALVLNAYAKVALGDAAPVSSAVVELGARGSADPPAPVVASLALGAMGRLGLLPPPWLERALLAHAPPAGLPSAHGWDAVRTVGALGALAKLDAASPASPLRPLVEPLLRRLSAMLSDTATTSATGDGRADRHWSARTVPMALSAVASLACGCGRPSCHLCADGGGGG
ncbi:unnamed protein product, partial [Prorocentrum cordatum]